MSICKILNDLDKSACIDQIVKCKYVWIKINYNNSSIKLKSIFIVILILWLMKYINYLYIFIFKNYVYPMAGALLNWYTYHLSM